MKQDQIIELLKEMATADSDRKNKILTLFTEALPTDYPGENGGPPAREDLHSDTMQTLLLSLLVHAPDERLVSCAPFVALMCGDRDEKSWTADIDWANLPAS